MYVLRKEYKVPPPWALGGYEADVVNFGSGSSGIIN